MNSGLDDKEFFQKSATPQILTSGSGSGSGSGSAMGAKVEEGTRSANLGALLAVSSLLGNQVPLSPSLARQVSKFQMSDLHEGQAQASMETMGTTGAPSRLLSPLLSAVASTHATPSSTPTSVSAPVSTNVLMIGTGEYTTGYVNGSSSDSDKSAGVVALTMLDLKSKGKIGRVGLCGVNGTKFPGIRQHMARAFNKYTGLSSLVDCCETWPSDEEIDPLAYVRAIASYKAGDIAVIFTPDDTHYDIAMACIRQGMHVLVTKPAVKTLKEHRLLHLEAQKYNVLVCVEVHKRWDPIYADARDQIQNLGPFSFLHSYMSQPKHQLETFRAWAGKSSDISYYLNSHHIDFHEWCVGRSARPVKVTALASTGVAMAQFGINCEDTITLTVEWENLLTDSSCSSRGTAVYTASWIAPRSDVHSQQRFFYMGHKGEVTVDQAHRGYHMAEDGSGYRSVNPLFMKYKPTDGKFAGQQGYGYRSFNVFIDAVSAVNAASAHVRDFDHSLASIATTYRTTAILEAGRLSLDSGKSTIIHYGDIQDACLPTDISVSI